MLRSLTDKNGIKTIVIWFLYKFDLFIILNDDYLIKII